ncbi:hypothetical protein INT43_005305 [Umbelopsis isabellina]|uniref:Uncharacterized protein n=1 Tax=Mortierella isabellina TaxID=91625 RepID=A0A8H7U8W7_MORIS|nr:hypothetical protein INT43_005305 [Umbelopsis isabellina]
MQSNTSIYQEVIQSQADPPDYQSQIPSDDANFPLPDYTSQLDNNSMIGENTDVSKQTGFFRSSRSKVKKFWDKTEIGKSSGFDKTKHMFFQPNTSPATH